MSLADDKIVADLSDAAFILKALCRCHENLRIHTQIILIAKALNMKFYSGTPISQVADKLNALHACIVTIGPIDYDSLHSVFLLNALGEHYLQLQSYIQATSDNPNFSSNTVHCAIQHEEDLIHHCKDMGFQFSSTALAA